MEQSEWIGALLVESFLSQHACTFNRAFLQKTFEYLNLSNELLEKDISNVPEQPLQCLYPIIHFTNPARVAMDASPSLSQRPVPYDDNEVKLEKFLGMKMAKEQETLVHTLKAASSQDAKANAYHSFMAEAFPRADCVCQLLKHDDEVSLYKALESIFCPKIYDLVFPTSPTEDAEFAVQTAKLRSKESFLGVTPEIIQKIKNVFALAGSELEQMERHVAPYAKLGCIERCCETLLKALGRVGADDLLPAVIYTVVQCNPTRFPSNLQYTMTFGDERAFNTQQVGYCHTTMMVAMEVVNRQKASEKVASAGGLGCPKCQGLGGLNCFGDPCKKGENLYQMVCPTCGGSCTVKGIPRKCEQCTGKGGKAKLGYCEMTDPFAVGRCEVCRGKCYLIGDTAPAPASPLSSFSQYYGTELTPSKYGFYRQTSGACQVERVMLPDLLSALVLFSLTTSEQKTKKPRPSSRRLPKVTLGHQDLPSNDSLPQLPNSPLQLPTNSLQEFAIEMKPTKSPRRTDSSQPTHEAAESPQPIASPTRKDSKPRPPPRTARNKEDSDSSSKLPPRNAVNVDSPKLPPRNNKNPTTSPPRNGSKPQPPRSPDHTDFLSPQSTTSPIRKNSTSKPTALSPLSPSLPSHSSKPFPRTAEPPKPPPRHPQSPIHRPLIAPAEPWMVGVKKEITVFYPAPVRSALKRLIHCLRSLGSMAKREKERDLLLETAEHAIATKWIHEMDDGRSLLAGEGYGINLGSDGVKEIYFHRVDETTSSVTCIDALPPPRMHALIAVMGVLDSPSEHSSATEELDELMRNQIEVECDKYILVWETQHLRRFGNTIKLFHHTSMQELRSTSSFPIAPMMIANQFKNAGVLANHPYIYLLQQAKRGGRILAEKLIRMGLGRRPVTLVGVSFGALLVFCCLEVLLELSAEQPIVNSLVENVIFIGANIPADTIRWSAIKPVVAGRIVNCFSTKDTFLKYFYQTVNSFTGDIENVDVSSFITSHVFYAKNQTISAILNFVDVGGVECNRNYSVANTTRRKSLTPAPLAPSFHPFPTEPSSIFAKLVQTIQTYIPDKL